jgi:flagellar biosynthesis protein FlhA
VNKAPSKAGANQDLILVAAIISILLILFAPVPPFLLDLFIILNFALGLTILLLTLYVDKPVAFSTFPALLLVATLYRLALNVAATRLILTDAHAGEVIDAIGAFAVQGSAVVGLVVFFILVIVQYVVVTSGAQRVSEVAARFVLDSMPGQQMSIDADLNMGLIDQNEAKRRRKDLEREASFYGAMDGASKFVKGDAVAGVIILLINIIAGWIIGIVQMGMDWSAALERFTLLTIGDGIATQVPALIISLATGIIVTRSSADRRLSAEIAHQLSSVPRVPLLVLGALQLLLLMPGMPKWPIIILAIGFALLWFRARRRNAEGLTGEPMETEPSGAQGATSHSPVEILLGKDLGEAWAQLKPVLTERIAALRQQHERSFGFAFPAVTFQDGPTLKPQSYEIHLLGARYANGAIIADRTLAISAKEIPAALAGMRTRDPAFGLPAAWVENTQHDRARDFGCSLVDPVTVLITHLGEVLRAEAGLLLTRGEVVRLLEGVRARQPGLIEELTPNILSVSDVQKVLQNLLAEDVSIRNIDLIAECLVDCGRHVKDHGELTEAVRQKLSHVICHALQGEHDQLAVLSLPPRVEAQISESIKRSEGKGAFVLDPRLAEQLLRRLVAQTEIMISERLAPVLLCGPDVRRHLKSFTRRAVPRLAILSVAEIPSTIDLRSHGVVSLD